MVLAETELSGSSLSHAQSLRILLVEDDPIMQLGLEHFFEDDPRCCLVGHAADGYSGVELALQLRPDLVVMDIGLPQLDGILATQQIKTQHPQIRIVMLTSHTTDQEMIAALASGADAYCVKGRHLDSLKRAIASAHEGAIYLDPQIARRVLDRLKPMPQGNHQLLSQRELQVLKLIVEGKTNPEIAAILYVSLSTVKAHVRAIMDKLAVDDRVQAAVMALRSGLV
ncbi:MAG: response regulator transcription factor [Synechococcales cyanobacterium C42_A2020_086]|jgi:DNA-binding NarL/FixJ family response regulator|nr:response regulator transcription factor [Synechococcales cyanobacterium M58_A2018_015]MBF2072390.1 response regulator transcription factor [Synechococcales cyanobacterium C42_A2020_086]